MRKGGVEVTEASKVSSKASGLCGQAGLSPSVGQGRIFLTVIAPLETDVLIYPLHHWLSATSRVLDTSGL